MKDYKKIVKYGFFGALTAGIEFVVFLLISPVTYTYVASFVSFSLGLISSFIFNKFIVFKNSKKVVKGEVAQFFVLGLVNSQLSSLITYGLAFITPKPIAKIVTMGLIAGWNYLLMNFIIFKIKEDK